MRCRNKLKKQNLYITQNNNENSVLIRNGARSIKNFRDHFYPENIIYNPKQRDQYLIRKRR